MGNGDRNDYSWSALAHKIWHDLTDGNIPAKRSGSAWMAVFVGELTIHVCGFGVILWRTSNVGNFRDYLINLEWGMPALGFSVAVIIVTLILAVIAYYVQASTKKLSYIQFYRRGLYYALGLWGAGGIIFGIG